MNASMPASTPALADQCSRGTVPKWDSHLCKAGHLLFPYLVLHFAKHTFCSKHGSPEILLHQLGHLSVMFKLFHILDDGREGKKNTGSKNICRFMKMFQEQKTPSFYTP